MDMFVRCRMKHKLTVHHIDVCPSINCNSVSCGFVFDTLVLTELCSNTEQVLCSSIK